MEDKTLYMIQAQKFDTQQLKRGPWETVAGPLSAEAAMLELREQWALERPARRVPVAQGPAAPAEERGQVLQFKPRS